VSRQGAQRPPWQNPHRPLLPATAPIMHGCCPVPGARPERRSPCCGLAAVLPLHP
jgi:hypothetical protein